VIHGPLQPTERVGEPAQVHGWPPALHHGHGLGLVDRELVERIRDVADAGDVHVEKRMERALGEVWQVGDRVLGREEGMTPVGEVAVVGLATPGADADIRLGAGQHRPERLDLLRDRGHEGPHVGGHVLDREEPRQVVVAALVDV
jgi:hypothetical protein